MTQPLCKCGSGRPVMPSTLKVGSGRCATCHYKRIAKYRATENGKAVTHAIKVRAKAKLKAEGIAAYGGACTCCGESHPAFLTIDHLNNDGGGRNRTEGGMLLWARLRAKGWPTDGFTLACFNCNTGRHLNGGVCPHQENNS